MNTQRASDPQMIDLLAGMDTKASMAAVQRTRRVVLDAANQLREQRKRNRRNAAIVALAITAIVALLTPTIWSTIDDYLGGEQFFDLPEMVMVLILMLFLTVFGALIIGFRSEGSLRYGRHGRR